MRYGKKGGKIRQKCRVEKGKKSEILKKRASAKSERKKGFGLGAPGRSTGIRGRKKARFKKEKAGPARKKQRREKEKSSL